MSGNVNLEKAKPILFNTEMVRAIQNGTKTVTRRAVKEPYYIDDEEASRVSGLAIHRGTNMTDGMPYPDQPYRPGDILYVRETWAKIDGDYVFKADDAMPEGWHLTAWHPSIHMPREAVRIFLRVTGVRVERLQEIDGRGILAEGIDNGNSNPAMGKRWENMQHMAFQRLWDSTIKKADRDLYGWEANPRVWVIEFERMRSGDDE